MSYEHILRFDDEARVHRGVGEQTFFVFPDGTTMLLDCGDTHHAKYMKDVPPFPPDARGGVDMV